MSLLSTWLAACCIRKVIAVMVGTHLDFFMRLLAEFSVAKKIEPKIAPFHVVAVTSS
jgi:hypothetical protein